MGEQQSLMFPADSKGVGISSLFFPTGIPLPLGGKCIDNTIFPHPFDRVTAVFKIKPL